MLIQVTYKTLHNTSTSGCFFFI